MTEFFSSKQPSEAYQVGFDFTSDLGVETISSATVTAVDRLSLEDVTGVVLDGARQSIAGPVVNVWVRAGTAGHEYLLTCRIVGSAGSNYELDGILPVAEIPVTPGASTFKDLLESDLDDVFYNEGEFASEVTYTPVTGTEQTILAIIGYGGGDEYKGADSYGVRCTMRLKAEDVAQPARSDEVTIGSARWIVIGAELNEDGREWIVQANKVTA